MTPAPLASAFTDGPFLWFANRGTGVVLAAVLTLSVTIGILSTVRAGSPRWPRFATQALHRNVSLLAVTLLGLHVVTAVVDTFVDIRWYDAFVPVGGGYEPVWLGLGALSLDLMAAITVTSLVRHRLSHGSWRALHLLSYLSWGLGIVHGVGIGTDSTTTWGAGVTVTCVGVVAAAGVVRLGTLAHERRIAA